MADFSFYAVDARPGAFPGHYGGLRLDYD